MSTADLAAASRQSRQAPRDAEDIEEAELEQDTPASVRTTDDASRGGRGDGEALEPLFAAHKAESYRNHWIEIQSSFVDDPRGAVRAGDELVAQVMSELASSFADQRARFESQLDTSGPGNTESLRVALRSYRSFFERLLSL